MDTPPDPFAVAAQAAETIQDHRYNEKALDALGRETSDRKLEKLMEVVRASKEPGQRIDPNAIRKEAEQDMPSARWSHLDELALKRCGAWIIHADSYGVGVTKNEAINLMSRDPQRISTGARAIIRRLSEVMASAPDADGSLAGSHPLLAGWIKEAAKATSN